MFYYKQYKYGLKFNESISHSMQFLKSPDFKTMIATNLLNILHAPPYFENQFIIVNLHYPVRYSLSTLLCVLVLLRCYLIVRLFVNLSSYASVEADLECKEAANASETFRQDFVFALKALMKQRPYMTIVVNFSISIVCFGFAVRAFER